MTHRCSSCRQIIRPIYSACCASPLTSHPARSKSSIAIRPAHTNDTISNAQTIDRDVIFMVSDTVMCGSITESGAGEGEDDGRDSGAEYRPLMKRRRLEGVLAQAHFRDGNEADCDVNPATARTVIPAIPRSQAVAHQLTLHIRKVLGCLNHSAHIFPKWAYPAASILFFIILRHLSSLHQADGIFEGLGSFSE
jgi:hypothetical protein